MEAERKDNIVAGAATITVHGLLLLLLLFSLLKTPNPPLEGGSGVVLNLGFVDEGSGEVQTMNEANDSPLKQEAKPQEVAEKSTEQEEKPQQPEDAKENWVAGEEETGVTAKTEEKQEEKKEVTAKKNVAEVEQKTTIITNEEKKATSGKTGTETEGGNNNGDKLGKVGDQGNPQGELNAKALYGNPGTGGEGKGGSGGSSLDMAGWKMDFKLKTDESAENGRLKFKIVVDGEGEVIKIETLEKSVSTNVENYYKKQIENGSFIKDKNAKTAVNSTGLLTIIIRSN
ncbi:MAG: hypothetical protein H7329_13015 [Opitutaceae bacterium]|nr:hypothetical protein [Cytophagales bacterium]